MRRLVAVLVALTFALGVGALPAIAQLKTAPAPKDQTTTAPAGPKDQAATAPASKPVGAKDDKKAAAKVDINSASKADLETLSGVAETYSQKIIDGRPYKRKDDLVKRNIVPQATYDKIKDQVVAKQDSAATATKKK